MMRLLTNYLQLYYYISQYEAYYYYYYVTGLKVLPSITLNLNVLVGTSGAQK